MTSNETCENTDAKKREFYFKFHHITLLSPVSDKRKEKKIKKNRERVTQENDGRRRRLCRADRPHTPLWQ